MAAAKPSRFRLNARRSAPRLVRAKTRHRPVSWASKRHEQILFAVGGNLEGAASERCQTASVPSPARRARDAAYNRAPDAQPRLPALPKNTASGDPSAAPRQSCESREEIPCPACDRLRRESARAERGNSRACDRENLPSGRASRPPAALPSAMRRAACLRIGRRRPEPRDASCLPRSVVVLLHNLHGQFARGNERQRSDSRSLVLKQLLDHRDQECQGFSGSGLRRGEYVLACQRRAESPQLAPGSEPKIRPMRCVLCVS